MLNDSDLLRSYVRTGSQEAFTALVHQKLPLVLSAALRRTHGDGASAEDITQTVFVLLARKAESLVDHSSLTGWLFTTTHHVASKALRRQQRRTLREEMIASMAASDHEDALPWEELRPVIDGAMLELSSENRTAVLLRFFENRSFGEIGALLQLTDNTARMRVNRALETLRSILSRHGITSTVSGLGLALSSHATSAVNPSLAVLIAKTALTTPIGTGLFFAMTSSSIKTTAAVIVAAASITYGIYERVEHHRTVAEVTNLRATLVRLAQEKRAPAKAPVTPQGLADVSKPPTAPAAPVLNSPATSVDASDPATNSEARKLYLAKETARLTMNVKPYFKTLGLSEEQWTGYVKAILEGIEIELDARGLALEKGLSSKQQELAMIEAMTGARKNLLEAIGADANRQLIDFNQRLAVRPRAEELAAKLAFTDQPLTTEQSSALVTALSKSRFQGKLRLRNDGILLLPDEAMEEIKAVLSPLQFEILQQQEIAHRSDLGLAKLKKAAASSPPK